MGAFARRLEKRNDARRELARLWKQPGLVNVVHYSCESFYDRPQGASARITSIAVQNVGSRQTTSFSIHQIAEEKSVPFDQIESHYDTLECEMIERYFEYVRTHSEHHWIHWNMRDIAYGFPAIQHRYRVLAGSKQPPNIPDSQLLDLASKFIDIYGARYAGHPRLQRIVELNKISKLDFLAGAEEAQALQDKDYVRLHRSTLRKVDVIHTLAEREWSGTLRTMDSLSTP